MPKQKTRKSAQKRFKKTGTGKFTCARAGKRHLNTGKSSKRKRRLSKSTTVNHTEIKRLKTSLPYA